MQQPSRQRDVRLDFFRGLAMFIIFIAHVPGNAWVQFVPARFGPSDATEMFVFCSGFASAIAFGSVFVRRGFVIGTTRVVFRCWQIYWAHITLFLIIVFFSVLGTNLASGEDYIKNLNLLFFFQEPRKGILGFMTLTYVPNYFDILPMYMVILLMLPIIMLLKKIHLSLVFLYCGGLYVATQFFNLEFPAEWWSDRPWFFNPLAWQLIFYTGFVFGAGWIRIPLDNTPLFIGALGFTILMVICYYSPIWNATPFLHTLSNSFFFGAFKTNFGIIRWLHFVCLAYVVLYLLHNREQVLARPVFSPIVKVGQQALATFMASMTFSWIGGMALDEIGRDSGTWALVNLSGFALIIVIAYIVAFFKSEPWRQRQPSPKPA